MIVSRDAPGPSRLHGVLLLLGLVPALVLLGRLSWDLGSLGWALTAAMSVFLPGFVALAVANGLAALTGSHAARAPSLGARVALALAIPTAFLASILDCMGLAFRGCTDTCTVLMDAGAPLMALLALLHFFTGSGAALVAMSVVSFAFLVPNCVCYNPINGPWIDLIGQSPACFAGSFGVTLVALGALRTGRLVAPAIAFVWCVNAAMLAFFVGHHYFDFPW